METVKRPIHDIRQQIVLLMEELQMLRDETRVHMHLAGMELRDRWNEFERHHTRLEEVLVYASDEALEPIRNALMDHRAALNALRDDLRADPEC